MQITANNFNPPLLLTVDSLKLHPFTSVKFGKTEISFKEKYPGRLFSAESIMVRPSLWTCLRGKLKLYFNCTAYGGVLNGYVSFLKERFKFPVAASLDFADVDLADFENIPALLGRRIMGKATGSINYRAAGKSLIEGNGEGNLKVLDGWVQLLNPILSLESIAFDELQAKMTLKEKRIKLHNVELKGADIRGSLSGIIDLKEDISKSSLDLKGTIEPMADFFNSLGGVQTMVKYFKKRLKKGKLSFTIRGTVADPTIKFI